MTFDQVIKYLIWIIFFGIAIIGVTVLLKKLGIT